MDIMKNYIMGLYFDLKENQIIQINLNSGETITIDKNDEITGSKNLIKATIKGIYQNVTMVINTDFVEYICVKEDY